MSTLHAKYTALRDALVTAPEYLTLPARDRQACTRFCGMVPQLGTDRAPPALEIRVAYETAIKEARSLVAEGSLTLDLDGGGQVEVSDTERPPADETSAPADEAPTGVQNGATTPIKEYPVHPDALIFPMMTNEELDDLVEDIRKNGLNHPITIHEGMVIDGRNRLEACRRAGVQPRYEPWKPTDSLAKWIFSTNYHRRTLNDGQRAMVAGKFALVMAEEGKKRQRRNLRKTSADPDGLDPGPRGNGVDVGAGSPHDNSGPASRPEPQETSEIVDGLDPGPREKEKAAEVAARNLTVSRDATNKAAKILRLGDQSLIQAVTTGRVSLDAAALVVELPKKEQRRLVERGEVKEAARRVRKEKAASKPKPKAKAKGKAAKATEPAANDNSSVDDVNEHEAGTDEAAIDDTPAEDENPLVRECHDAVSEMIRVGREVGEVLRVDKVLRDITTACRKVTTRFRAGPMPPLA